MAKKWIDLAKEGDHYKLAFDSTNTWSQKYNLVWDDLLALKLFPASVKNTELAYTRQAQSVRPPTRQPKRLHKARLELWTQRWRRRCNLPHVGRPLGKWAG